MALRNSDATCRSAWPPPGSNRSITALRAELIVALSALGKLHRRLFGTRQRAESQLVSALQFSRDAWRLGAALFSALVTWVHGAPTLSQVAATRPRRMQGR
jgi:hypothetical protein